VVHRVGTAAVMFIVALNLVQEFELCSQSMQIPGYPISVDLFKDKGSWN